LAAQRRDLAEVAVTMLVFGVGAALPLLAFGLASREAIMRWRHRIASAGRGLKTGLGLVLMAAGALVLTGLDKTLETAMVEVSPQWLTDLTTRF
jgi:cytochrome c biogenesis protein CcdA